MIRVKSFFILVNSFNALNALKGLRPEGRMVIMGVSTEPLNIPTLPLFLYRQHIIHMFTTKWY
jgi:hypothetical protein